MRESRTVLMLIPALLLMSLASRCPPSDGVIRYEEGTQDGYTLLNIQDGADPGRALLIDMAGKEIHTYQHALAGHMMPDGGFLGIGMGFRPLPLYEARSVLQETWDGAVEWEYSGWEELGEQGCWSRNHHDFQRQGTPVDYYSPGQDFDPDGNTLILAHQDVTVPEISGIPLLDDIIYEVDWSKNQTGFVWRAAEHVDEFGFDQKARNEIAEHGGDWLHTNTLSRLGPNRWYDENPSDTRFHPDNIMIDSRHAGFIVIIDHETGQVVWRVGPDYSPGSPEAGLGPLVGLHNAHMIPRGLPGEGNILVFDNGGASGWGGPILGRWRYFRDYTRVVEFDPTTLEIVWEHTPEETDNEVDWSILIGGVQRLPNGNTLVTCGVTGQILEVAPDHRSVWEYKAEDMVYRAYRVPWSWVPGNPSGYDQPWM